MLILIARVRDKFHRYFLREFKAHGIEELSPSHGDILFVLASRKRATMRDLATRIDRDKSTLTSLVNKLEAGGYVRRTRDPNDNRITYIEPTRKSRRVTFLMYAISRRLLRECYGEFTETEKRTLVELLDKLRLAIPGD
jgi:DNA-binding MarR family transcriptional regulator